MYLLCRDNKAQYRGFFQLKSGVSDRDNQRWLYTQSNILWDDRPLEPFYVDSLSDCIFHGGTICTFGSSFH